MTYGELNKAIGETAKLTAAIATVLAIGATFGCLIGLPFVLLFGRVEVAAGGAIIGAVIAGITFAGVLDKADRLP